MPLERSLVQAWTIGNAMGPGSLPPPIDLDDERTKQMSNYIQLGDVHTYYEEDGAGQPLVLLHPGLADSRAFEDYVPELAQHFHVFRPDRRGHGRTPDLEGPITYQLMAQDTIAFLEQVVGGPASLLGHSDGAPVALLAALERPDLVRKLVLSAGVFHHDGWAPGAIDLDDETIAFFTDYWGAVAPDGPDHFLVVKAKLDRMHREEPTLTVARPRRLPRPGAGHGRRQRRGDPHRAHPRPPPGTAQRATGRAARHRPRRHRCQDRHQLPDQASGGGMIARTWRGTVHRADADEYAEYIRATGFADTARRPATTGHGCSGATTATAPSSSPCRYGTRSTRSGPSPATTSRPRSSTQRMRASSSANRGMT
jgi:pimeloyl-ACP methyl ester carboxylesterase